MATRPDDLIYAVDEWPPWPTLLLLGVQQAVLASVYLVLLVIVARAAGVPTRTALDMVGLGMLALAVSTVLQALWKGPIGSGYLAVPVYSAIYLGPSVLAAKAGGLPVVFGMTIVAGLVEIALSRCLHRLRALFPPAVSGLIVAVVGIELGLVGIDQLLGVEDYRSPDFHRHLAVAFLTLAVAVGSSVWARGLMRLMCSAIAIAIGSAAALALGLIPPASLATVLEAPVWSVPDPRFIAYRIDAGLLPVFVIAGVAAALRTVGVVTTCQKINDSEWKRPDTRSIEGGMLADGLGCAVAGVLGTMGMNTGPSLVGVAKASGATSRYIAFACGGFLVLFAFLPKIASVLLALPTAVVGSALVFTASFMIAGGIQVMVSRNIDTRMTYVIGIALLLGLGQEVYRAYFASVPALLRPLTGSMLSLSLVVALALNLLFRIGIRRTETFAFEDEQHLSPDAFGAFLKARGRAWNASGEVIDRATATTIQVLEHLAAARLVQGGARATVSYDQLELLIDIAYDGTVLNLPNAGVKRGTWLEEESFSYGLADFLTGVYPDRMESSAKGSRVSLRLYFSV
jgi:NCS2 family nucleobase:cation symporter-2